MSLKGDGGNVDIQKGSPDESYRFDNVADPANPPRNVQPVETWRPWAESQTANAFDSLQFGKEKGYHSARTPSPLPTWAALINKADHERQPLQP